MKNNYTKPLILTWPSFRTMFEIETNYYPPPPLSCNISHFVLNLKMETVHTPNVARTYKSCRVRTRPYACNNSTPIVRRHSANHAAPPVSAWRSTPGEKPGPFQSETISGGPSLDADIFNLYIRDRAITHTHTFEGGFIRANGRRLAHHQTDDDQTVSTRSPGLNCLVLETFRSCIRVALIVRTRATICAQNWFSVQRSRPY